MEPSTLAPPPRTGQGGAREFVPHRSQVRPGARRPRTTLTDREALGPGKEFCSIPLRLRH